MKRLVAALVCMAMPFAAAHAAGDGADEAPLANAARLNAQLAVAYLKQNDIAVAREKIEKALVENPKDSSVQMSAGLVYEGLQDVERADRHYSTALKLEPNNPDVQNIYAVFLCRNGHAAQGQKVFEQAARNPSYKMPEVAFSNAGVCARGAGDLGRAEELFRKAIALRPDFPDALLQLADLTYQKGGGIGARALLERYFRVAPATPDSLLLGINIERKLGDQDAARRYQTRLLKEFPDSAQSRDIRGGSDTP